jgi:glucose/mannose-6-phosphate isomerase
VTELDDVRAIRAVDGSDMLGAIGGLSADCRSAYDSSSSQDLPAADGVRSVIVCGMGGSAMSGELLRSAFGDRIVVPVLVNRGYTLPAFAGTHTLVIGSSYSGNTAETLSAFTEAVSRGCRLLAISAGGELSRMAEDAGAPIVHMPAGFQPRAALGHLGFALFGALQSMGLLPHLETEVLESVSELQRLTGQMVAEVPSEANPAKRLAALIQDRVPVIWGAGAIGEVAAMRWKTQFNENGKVPAFCSAMSELDHNEVVGWTKPYGNGFTLIALRHDGEPSQDGARFPLSYEIARAAGVATQEVRAGGRSSLARLMGLIVIGDFVSAYLGIRRGVDPTPVDAITRLKAALAEA